MWWWCSIHWIIWVMPLYIQCGHIQFSSHYWSSVCFSMRIMYVPQNCKIFRIWTEQWNSCHLSRIQYSALMGDSDQVSLWSQLMSCCINTLEIIAYRTQSTFAWFIETTWNFLHISSWKLSILLKQKSRLVALIWINIIFRLQMVLSGFNKTVFLERQWWPAG